MDGDRNYKESQRRLEEELLLIQKKTFTKWINAHLKQVKMEMNDIFVDLSDGIMLQKFLEILFGENLPPASHGRMRIHKIDNVNKCLNYIRTKIITIGDISAENIVDGTPKLILGLIWSIILKSSIQDIEMVVNEEKASSETVSGEAALLLWAQRKTRNYEGVQIKDFSSSWRTGLGFNALIHAYRSNLFDYNALLQNSNTDNLNHAFDLAYTKFNIPRLLEAKDVDTPHSDKRSVITYISLLYHTFAEKPPKVIPNQRRDKLENTSIEAVLSEQLQKTKLGIKVNKRRIMIEEDLGILPLSINVKDDEKVI